MLEAIEQDFDGRLKRNQPLAGLSWLRTGGEAQWFFQPKDADDLAVFLRAVPKDVPIFPMGVGSNTIFRDGGYGGVVIRLGRAFAGLEIGDDGEIYAGAALLGSMVARKAAAAGRDLTFLRTIPGAIGGAIAMNAGCYGLYVADRLERVELMSRAGERMVLDAAGLRFHYRKTDLPDGAVILGGWFRAPADDTKALEARMEEQLAKRAETQPVDERSCGSTFRNPVGHSSTGEANEDHSLKAWKVIDDAGLRGASIGGAQMSPKHPNFLINTGSATAFDLEALGEKVRKDVKSHSGIELAWEIKRVGRFGDGQAPDWPLDDEQ